jgi:Stage II sporulation protein
MSRRRGGGSLPHVNEGALAAPRTQRRIGRLLLLASLAAVTLAAPLAPQVTSPALARSCGTDWHSRTQAPDTIRVYRSRTDTVETVSFRQYVGIVMASGEFPTWLPRAVLEVGATAVKQYAWYYALEGHHRSGYRTSSGACYDVRDDTMDQTYRPEKANPKPNQLAAIEATWGLTLRKHGRFFLTGYRTGTADRCARDADGWRIYTRSAQDCATSRDWSRRQIQEAYYRSGLEFVWSEPGPAGGGTHDRTDPRVSTPRVTLVAGQQLGRRVARITWHGDDAGGSGLAHYQLQRRSGSGAWHTVQLQGVLATTFRFQVSPTASVHFRLRAIDGAGNHSDWKTAISVRGHIVQSGHVTLRGPWRTLVKPAASGGTSRFTVTKGARATFRFTGRSVAVVAPTGPGRGKARIFLDGKRVAIIDLRGSDHRQRQLVWARTWSTAGRHTLRVQSLGTRGRPRVDIDAFLVLR